MPKNYIKNSLNSDSTIKADRYFRLKVLFYMSLSLAAMICIAAPIRHLINPIKPAPLFVAVMCGIGLFFVPKIYSTTKSQVIASVIPLAALCLLIGVASFFASGLRAPINFLIITIPIMATFFLGRKGGAIFYAICLVVLSFSFTAFHYSWLPTSALDDVQILQKSLFIIITVCLTVSLFLGLLYEKERIKSMAFKDQIISSISHELRTPLTAIVGAAKLVIHVDEIEQKSMLQDIIQRNSDLIQTLLNDILDTQRLETGRLTIEKIPTNSLTLLQDIVTGMPQIKIASNSQEINISVDRNRMRQIFTNLISNAIKFSYERSPIEIGCRLQANQFGEVCVLWVRDYGRGIPNAKIKKIFRRFYQAQASDAGKDRGMGLGLHITQQLVEAQDGRIWVESEVGKGSTFYVEFAALPKTANLPETAPDLMDVGCKNLDSNVKLRGQV